MEDLDKDYWYFYLFPGVDGTKSNSSFEVLEYDTRSNDISMLYIQMALDLRQSVQSEGERPEPKTSQL